MQSRVGGIKNQVYLSGSLKTAVLSQSSGLCSRWIKHVSGAKKIFTYQCFIDEMVLTPGAVAGSGIRRVSAGCVAIRHAWLLGLRARWMMLRGSSQIKTTDAKLSKRLHRDGNCLLS